MLVSFWEEQIETSSRKKLLYTLFLNFVRLHVLQSEETKNLNCNTRNTSYEDENGCKMTDFLVVCKNDISKLNEGFRTGLESEKP